MRRALCAALLLFPALARAARYDPDADRFALRQAATASRAAVVNATGLALEPEKAPTIAAGLDEGLRQARLASDAARALGAAAERRHAEMAAAVKPGALELKLKEASDPVAAERLRWQGLTYERLELKKKVDDLPDEEKKKLLPRLAAAADALSRADGGLSPLEQGLKIAGERALEMKEARQEARTPLDEIASSTAAAAFRAAELASPLAEAKARLGALGAEPRDVARSRAWEKLAPLRDITRLLFEAADRACNRADDFRRLSSSFETASAAFEKARPAASSAASAKSLLDAAQAELTFVRERLKKPR